VVVAGGAAAIAADVAVDEDVDVELLLLLCEPASPMTISTAMTAKTMNQLGTDCFFFGNPPAAGGGAAGPQFLPSQARLPASDGSGYQPGAGGGGCVIAETVRAPRAVCRWFGVEHRVADRRRDDFPNNFVGDLVKTDSGGLWCRRRAARKATTTARTAGRSARSGAPATGDTWPGGVGAAQCYAPQPGPRC
jgi:hypothetical protein